MQRTLLGQPQSSFHGTVMGHEGGLDLLGGRGWHTPTTSTGLSPVQSVNARGTDGHRSCQGPLGASAVSTHPSHSSGEMGVRRRREKCDSGTR